MSDSEPSSGLSPRQWGVLIFLAGLLLFLPTVSYEFTYDDSYVILSNPLVQSPALFSHLWLRSYLGGDVQTNMGHWRPLGTTTHAVMWWVFGHCPSVCHLINALIHALNGLLVFGLARRWLRCDRAAGIAGLLFALHPIHIEAVANVIGRAELLVMMFTLLAWRVHLGGRPTPARAASAALLYLCAMLCKESAIPGLGLFVLGDAIMATRRDRAWVRERLPLWLAHLGALVAFLVLRRMVLGIWGAPDIDRMPTNPLSPESALTQWLTAITVLAFHWRLLLWPVALQMDYAHSVFPVVTSPLDPRFIASVIALGALAALAIWAWRRARGVTLGIVIHFTAVSIVSNIVFLTGIMISERGLYLPSLGLCLVAGVGGAALLRRWPSMVWALVALGMALGAQTAAQMRLWSDDLTLFTHVAQRGSNSTMVWANLAAARQRTAIHRGLGVLDQPESRALLLGAIEAADRALEIWPENLDALASRGQAWSLLGEPEPALSDFEAVLEKVPYHGLALRLRLNLARERHELDLIDPLVEAALARNPHCVVALQARARWRLDQRRPEEALEAAEHLVDLLPFSAVAWGFVAEARAALGDAEGAAEARHQVERWHWTIGLGQ
jgi:protein O-mannosyl-transferase